ncbi:hypothetical protein SLOPH_929 [Spraguea lophii 42_110]|uniref:Uncharacterized protein n=1 Tax=Spraguea lophii (strain 42_110) TaxID=1358809 RepID=S7WB34_SPRLO|nr:hypothetical protein SLOPH_929 [Spraguea lophii 42_110]
MNSAFLFLMYYLKSKHFLDLLLCKEIKCSYINEEFTLSSDIEPANNNKNNGPNKTIALKEINPNVNQIQENDMITNQCAMTFPGNGKEKSEIIEIESLDAYLKDEIYFQKNPGKIKLPRIFYIKTKINSFPQSHKDKEEDVLKDKHISLESDVIENCKKLKEHGSLKQKEKKIENDNNQAFSENLTNKKHNISNNNITDNYIDLNKTRYIQPKKNIDTKYFLNIADNKTSFNITGNINNSTYDVLTKNFYLKDIYINSVNKDGETTISFEPKVNLIPHDNNYFKDDIVQNNKHDLTKNEINNKTLEKSCLIQNEQKDLSKNIQNSLLNEDVYFHFDKNSIISSYEKNEDINEQNNIYETNSHNNTEITNMYECKEFSEINDDTHIEKESNDLFPNHLSDPNLQICKEFPQLDRFEDNKSFKCPTDFSGRTGGKVLIGFLEPVLVLPSQKISDTYSNYNQHYFYVSKSSINPVKDNSVLKNNYFEDNLIIIDKKQKSYDIHKNDNVKNYDEGKDDTGKLITQNQEISYSNHLGQISMQNQDYNLEFNNTRDSHIYQEDVSNAETYLKKKQKIGNDFVPLIPQNKKLVTIKKKHSQNKREQKPDSEKRFTEKKEKTHCHKEMQLSQYQQNTTNHHEYLHVSEDSKTNDNSFKKMESFMLSHTYMNQIFGVPEDKPTISKETNLQKELNKEESIKLELKRQKLDNFDNVHLDTHMKKNIFDISYKTYNDAIPNYTYFDHKTKDEIYFESLFKNFNNKTHQRCLKMISNNNWYKIVNEINPLFIY